jgi:hypothetical protein
MMKKCKRDLVQKKLAEIMGLKILGGWYHLSLEKQ